MNIDTLLTSLKRNRNKPDLHSAMCFGTATVFVECQPDGTFSLNVPVPNKTLHMSGKTQEETKEILQNYSVERAEV